MYTIRDFAALCGVTPRALRLYEEKGLLSPARDPENQYRLYDKQAHEQIKTILFFRGLGFSLQDIQTLLTAELQLPQIRGLLTARLKQSQTLSAQLQDQTLHLQQLLQYMDNMESAFPGALPYKLSRQERKTLMTSLTHEFTSIGQRKSNQDYTWVQEFPEAKLLMIADGFGEDETGPQASQIACERFAQRLAIENINPARFESEFQAILTELHREIYTEVEGATTFTALLIKGNDAYLAHLGDCRAYCLRKGHLQQLTQDHSTVQKLLDAGEILAKDVPQHPLKGQLYSVLGFSEAMTEVQYLHFPVGQADGFLLLSDGVCQTLSHQEITEVIQNKDFPNALTRLQQLAEQHGEDNASAVGLNL